MTFANVASELDHRLHTLHLALYLLIKVLLFDFWEGQEVDRAPVAGLRIFWDEALKLLVDVLSQEGGI